MNLKEFIVSFILIRKFQYFFYMKIEDNKQKNIGISRIGLYIIK